MVRRAILVGVALLVTSILTGTPADAAVGEPDTVVSSPQRNEAVTSPVTFTGTTTDDVAVDRVQVAIRNRDGSGWLRSDGSFGAFMSFAATVDAVGAASSPWNIDFDLPPGLYGASVRSIDGDGVVETTRPWVRFEVVSELNTEPDSTITSPVFNQEFEGQATFAGDASDNSAVAKVRLAIKNRDTNMWVQDAAGSFGAQFALIDTVLSDPDQAETGWTFAMDLPAGNYFMSARAVDDIGAVESTRPVARFSVVDGPDPQTPPFTFRAIADLPYNASQLAELLDQLPNLNADEEFVVHLGDIKAGKDRGCEETFYQTTHDALLTAPVPAYIIPGDNEWNDCDDMDAAWALWDQYFGAFEQNYTDGPTVIRQTIRPENFAFIQGEVAFIGINNVGNQQVGQLDWGQLHRDNAAWVTEILDGPGALTNSAVIFGHAHPRRSLAEAMTSYEQPVLYLMGDLHNYDVAVPHRVVAPNLTRVILDAGMPGLSVTMTHDPADPWILNRTP